MCALAGGLGACSPSAADDPTPDAATSRTDENRSRTEGTPLPEYDATSRVGDLADGFPADVVPVPPGAEVLASSAAPGDGVVQITLNLRTPDEVDEVTDYYAAALDEAGFTVSPSKEASALTALTTFLGPQEDDAAAQSVAVGVFDDGDERLVTISGQVASD